MSEVESQRQRRQEHEIHAINFAIRDSLKFKNNRISIINADPTTKSFVFWFFVSCYFPVITACLGPIANTISVACVVEKWRQIGISDPKLHDGDINSNQLADPHWIFAINVLSLVLGFISNLVLLCHFARRLSYFTSQLLNIIGWTAAGVLLLVDVILCSSLIHEGQSRTLGFWYASFTSGLYLGCALTLTTHFIGYKLEKYPPTFNILPNERIIMIFTVFFSLWLIWGAGLFSGLMHISFGNALYFCVVSLLTVGFGDILPNNVASKVMILFFSLSGIFILGLIVYMTRSIIQKSSGPVWYYHRLESSRSKVWDQILNGELRIDNEEGFYLMKKMKRRAYYRGNIYSILTTMIIFILFWLLGALVFCISEGWSYFNSMYFCFLCLLTIGYGSDFAPSTGAGRSFFVVWGIGAIPMMSALISAVSDLLFDLSDRLNIQPAKKFNIGFDKIKVSNKLNPKSFKISDNEIIGEFINRYKKHGKVKDDKDISNSVHDSLCSNKDHDSLSLSTFRDMVAKNWNPKQRRIFDDLGSISDIEDTDSDIIPHLADYDSESFISLTKPPSNRSKNESKKLEILKHLIKSLKILHKTSLEDENFKLSYQQWTNIHSIYPTHELMLTDLENDNFWISDRTPLKFPLNESHLAFLRIYDATDKLIDDIINDEQEETSSSNVSNHSNANSSDTTSFSFHTRPHRRSDANKKSC